MKQTITEEQTVVPGQAIIFCRLLVVRKMIVRCGLLLAEGEAVTQKVEPPTKRWSLDPVVRESPLRPDRQPLRECAQSALG